MADNAEMFNKLFFAMNDDSKWKYLKEVAPTLNKSGQQERDTMDYTKGPMAQRLSFIKDDEPIFEYKTKREIDWEAKQREEEEAKQFRARTYTAQDWAAYSEKMAKLHKEAETKDNQWQ
jgi:hypothetical protein